MGWNGLSRPRPVRLVAALFVVCQAGFSASPARSQTLPNEYSVSNTFITATLGARGTATLPAASNRAGRLGVAELVTPSELMTYIGFGPHESYVTVRIDGGPPTPGADADTQTSTGWDLIFGDVGSNALDYTSVGQKTDQSAWIQEPTAVGNIITAKWATLPGANASFPIPPIEIDLKITLIHDMARYEFTVINRDSRSHTVGLRLAQDVDAAVVKLPLHTGSVGPVTTKTDLVGSLVPATWWADYSNGAIGGGTLISTSATPAVTRPDRFVVGTFADVPGSLWNFSAVPPTDLTGQDVSVGVYFNPTLYVAGESKVISTYYGRNHSTIDYDTPFVAGVDAPFSVKYDPTQPVGQQFTPNPMTVTGFVYNPRTFGLTNATALITLPPGLALAAGETASKTIGNVAANSEASVSWSVVPTGTATGNQAIGVSFTAGPGTLGKVVTRIIELPSLPVRDFPGGIQMVSFPFNFDDPTPNVALGLSAIDFDLLRWNPVLNQYEPVNRIMPGEAYWLRLAATRTITLQGAKNVTVGTAPFEIKLRQGWEQIGNPFLYRVNWADVQVINTDVSDPDALKPFSIIDAAQRGWMLPTIYRYDPVAGEYVYNSDLTMDLLPYEGYWVKALRPNLSLLIPPSSGRAVKVSADTRAASAAPAGWRLRLALRGEHTQDTYNFIGLAAGASDGVDKYDVEEPPAIQNAVRLGISRPTWGRRAGVYAADIQAMGGRKQWDVVVNSPAPNENVSLSWPDISRLPKGYELTITDKSTGVRTLMRQTLSLRVNTGASASRSYTITAEPRNRMSSLLLDVHVDGRAAGLPKVIVGSNVDATFTVRVLGASGSTLRSIAGGRAVSSTQSTTVIWDGKDNRGISVPAGAYTLEVKGVTPDGQVAKRVVPVTIVR